MPRGSTLERRSRRSQGQPRFVSQPLCARWTHSLPLALRGEWHCRFRDVDSIKAFAVLLIIPSRVVLSNSFSVAVHKFSSDLPRPLPFAFLALSLSSFLLPSFPLPPRTLLSKQRANILKEVQIMRGLQHPGIVRLLGFQESREHYYLTLEYAYFPSLALVESR